MIVKALFSDYLARMDNYIPPQGRRCIFLHKVIISNK